MSSSAALASHEGANLGTGRVLAIDYGRNWLGLALSDPLRVTAQPLARWKRANRRREVARLRDLCREREVSLILVGYPLRLDGTKSEMAEEAAQFAGGLRSELGKPVELVDERLSSWEAEQTVGHNTGGRPRFRERRRHKRDEVAAAVILRDYLQCAARTA